MLEQTEHHSIGLFELKTCAKFHKSQVTTCKYVILEIIIKRFRVLQTVKDHSYHLIFLSATLMFHLYKYETYKTLCRRPSTAQTDSDSLGGEHFSLTQFVLTHMCFTLCNSPPPTYFSETRHSIQGFHTQSSSIPRGQWTNWPRVFDGAAPRKTNDFVVKRYLWRHQPVSQSRLPGGDCSSAKQST